MQQIPAVSVADLDVDAATRQALGPSYDRPAALSDDLSSHWAGRLVLPPHPSWEGDRMDWTADPFQDRNWQFQHHTLRWLNPLRWSALDGDARARDEWRAVARSWFHANVPPSSAASAFAWKDMADGNRALQLSLGAALLADDDEWFIDLLKAHREWLMDPEHIVGKNHGLHQHTGLFVLGAVMRDDEAMDTAVTRMADQFATTFDAQGCNDEGSTAYHQMNLRWWSQAWRRVALEGRAIPDFAAHRLAGAGTVLAHLAQPDGRLPQIGDSSRGPVSRGLDPVADFAATKGVRGTRPKATALVLDGGYAISRSGWGEQRKIHNESHMILRHGPFVRAHAHADLGSVHIYAAGRPWLVDSGFHSYQSADRTRQHLHSRQAHNLALLPEREYSPRSTVAIERTEITETVHDFAVLDPGYPGVQLRRRVIYLAGPDCWIIRDTADGDTGSLLRQHWQADLGLRCRRHDRGFTLQDKDRSMSLTWLGGTPRLSRHEAQDGDLRGWVGTRWKTLKPGTLLTAERQNPDRGLTVLIAPNAGTPLGIVDSYVTTSGTVTATLCRGGDAWKVRIEDRQEVVVSPVL